MATSDERREVAARLRNLPSDPCADIKKWQADGLFIDANLSDEADYSQIYNAVLGTFPAEYAHPGDYEELHERIADLIDPTCHIVGTNSYDWSYGSETYIYHLSCGHAVYTYWEDPPTFCPDCGARLVVE